MPDEVWGAIRDYLQVSGRLESIQPADYVFAPLAGPLHHQPGDQAHHWNPSRPLSPGRILTCLKLYGRLVGIPAGRLTMPVLRYTAVALRLEAGDSLAELRAFLDTDAQPRYLQEYLHDLPALQSGGPELSAEQLQAIPLPERASLLPSPGYGFVHGFYARQQPPEAVAQVLKERVRGVDDELEGLRSLGRGLLELMERAASSADAARLGQAYTQVAARLGEMMRLEQQLAKAGGYNDVDRFLAFIDHVWADAWQVPPPSVEFRAEFLRLGGGAHLAGRDLKEETAALRVVLRRTYQLALGAQDSQEYARLVDLYGTACIRLMRLLKLDLGKGDVLDRGLFEMHKRTVEAICEEDAQGIRHDDFNHASRESSAWSEANFEALLAAGGNDSPLMEQWLEESSQYWDDL